jgi:hypothetical protein
MKQTMTVEHAKRVLGLTLDRELSEWFGVKPGSVWNWRDAGTLPAGKVAQVHLHVMRANGSTKR